MKVFVVLNVLLLRGDFFSRFPLDDNSSLTSYRMMPPLLCSLGRGAQEMFKVVLFISAENTSAGPPLSSEKKKMKSKVKNHALRSFCALRISFKTSTNFLRP